MHLANLYFWPRWSTYSQGMSFHVGSSHKAMSRQRMFGGEEDLLEGHQKERGSAEELQKRLCDLIWNMEELMEICN